MIVKVATTIGQLMVVGFDGVAMTAALRALITDLRLGGLVLFQRNVQSPTQLRQLIADAQQVAHDAGLPPLLICIDQEGGRVARLRAEHGFTEFPTAKEVAANGIAAVKQTAQAMAREMRDVGINVDLAPVLDVNNNPNNPVIGDRSFGDAAKRVAECGVAFIESMQGAGILCVGKHFPGHGDVAVDSHIGLPSVPHERERLHAVEFEPFKAAIVAGVAGIMSAHVAFPAIEPSGLPATLSPNVMTHLLRDELGYSGLLFTDSLEMGALAANGYPVPIASATALQAGADVLLFNSGDALHRQAHAEMCAWVERGDISHERIEAAVQRVNAAKQGLT